MRRDERPISIAFFSDAPWVGGAERYLFLLASHLPASEFAPVIILNDGPGLERLRRWCGGARLPVREASLRLPASPVGVGGFIRLLRTIKPAILHCNLPGPWDSQFSLVAPIARFAGVPHVVSTEHLAMIPSFAKGAILKRFGTLWIDKVITVSENNVGHLVRNHGVPRGKIDVIRIGIPEPVVDRSIDVRAELGLSKEDFVCIMVGSLEERKGYPAAFAALAGLPERIKLVIAGGGEREREYRSAAARLGLEGRVRFLGYREDVDALLVASDALLVPSTLEATPFVIVEAMAAGLPVIASRIYGIPELVRERTSGILIEPGMSDELARAIRALAADHDLWRRMGAEARKRFEADYRIDRCVAETESLYHGLLRGDGSGGGRT
jgi:glycosyltransferase involved in cell wall biosynthesis